MIFVFGNSFVGLCSQTLYSSFNELYQQSQLLGHWKSFSPQAKPPEKVKEWKFQRIYGKGEIVMYRGKAFVAQGRENLSRPDSFIPSLLHVSTCDEFIFSLWHGVLTGSR